MEAEEVGKRGFYERKTKRSVSTSIGKRIKRIKLNFQELIEKSWKPVVIFFIFGGSLWIGKEELLSSVKRFQQAREQKIAAQIARKRFEEGCIVVMSHATSNPASLVKNMPVYNPENSGIFPEGTIVCDIYGNTGIMKKESLEIDIKFMNKFTLEKGKKVPVISNIKYTGKKPPEFNFEKYSKGYIGRVTNTKND